MRLAAYLLKTRVIGHEEEGRYQEIRRNWQTNIGFKFLLFFEGQALLCVVLSVPFLLAAMNPTEGFQWFEYLGSRHLGDFHFGRIARRRPACCIQTQTRK